jgi:hypothetical protein
MVCSSLFMACKASYELDRACSRATANEPPEGSTLFHNMLAMLRQLCGNGGQEPAVDAIAAARAECGGVAGEE